MYMRVHLHALWGKVGGDFLRQQVRSPGRAASPVSTKPTAGFLTAHRRARAAVRLQHQPPKTPENELGGRGAAVTAAGSALDGWSSASAPFPGRTGSAFRPAREEAGGGGGSGSVTGSQAVMATAAPGA